MHTKYNDCMVIMLEIKKKKKKGTENAREQCRNDYGTFFNWQI